MVVEAILQKDWDVTRKNIPVNMLRITAGPYQFVARMEEGAAPLTCAAFQKLLPFRNRIIQARWSGEAAWIPLGDFQVGVPFENHTSHPAPGDILLYPGGYSETEILFPYGAAMFASKMGQLAGNHFLTLVEGREHLPELGRTVLWAGAQDIVFEAVEGTEGAEGTASARATDATDAAGGTGATGESRH